MDTSFQDRQRALVKRMVMNAGCGHAGGSLSMAEIMASLFEDIMRYDVQNPTWEDRDRLILSKGHAGLGLYAALHLAGYLEEELLYSFAVEDGALMNHPEQNAAHGIEVSTGSLGHGLPIAVGMALAGVRKEKDYFTYCVLGDAEIQEGVIWEAAMFAASRKLRRLVAIIDRNHIGNDGPVDAIVSLEPLQQKWESFGFRTVRVDGHDRAAITQALTHFRQQSDGPYALIAETEKGKGLRPDIAGTGKAHYIKGTRQEIEASFLAGK